MPMDPEEDCCSHLYTVAAVRCRTCLDLDRDLDRHLDHHTLDILHGNLPACLGEDLSCKDLHILLVEVPLVEVWEQVLGIALGLALFLLLL